MLRRWWPWLFLAVALILLLLAVRDSGAATGDHPASCDGKPVSFHVHRAQAIIDRAYALRRIPDKNPVKAREKRAWREHKLCVQDGARDRIGSYQRHAERHYDHKWRNRYVLEGRVSWFTGQGMAFGGNASTTPAIALNINPGTDFGWDNSTTRAWGATHQKFLVEIAGHSAVLPVYDLGPAGSTGRAIDVTGPGVDKLGLSRSSFPTDSIGTATLIPE
jgi:hypothetical protein